MIEPTETETKQTIDSFVDAMIAIRRGVVDRPSSSSRPRTTRGSAASTKRAARQPRLRYRASDK
jgi:glycine dehydrogenase subunit 2